MAEIGDILEVEAFLRRHEKVAEPTLLNAGQRIGEWSVAAFLGKGGCGEVYQVKHVHLGMVAAMKVLTREDEITRDRFRREADIIVKNTHPAFPRFLGFGDFRGHPYLVIELLEQGTLPSSDHAVAQFMYKLCAGVSVLHGLGLVHRDIKPQNVLWRGATGDPVLIDLGLVKDVTLCPMHQGVSLSIVDGKAVGVGTPKYSAPEQFAGGEISPAADVHALGMLANECFSGKPPRTWSRIIRRSTSSIPLQRYATVDEFVSAVKKRRLYLYLNLAAAVLIVFTVIGVVGYVRNVNGRVSREGIYAQQTRLDISKERVEREVQRMAAQSTSSTNSSMKIRGGEHGSKQKPFVRESIADDVL